MSQNQEKPRKLLEMREEEKVKKPIFTDKVKKEIRQTKG